MASRRFPVGTTVFVSTSTSRRRHVAVWANDRPSKSDYYLTGHYVPICGSDRDQAMRVTGPGKPLCQHCYGKVVAMAIDAAGAKLGC